MTPNFRAVAYMLHICWWYSHDMKQASGAGKENCMLHKRDRLTKTISSSRSDARVENSCSRWQRMHLILSVCFDLLRAPVRWELFASGHVRLCHAAQQTELCGFACETLWHRATSDFTYGCTWRWCADSWAAAACTRGFSSRGRQTWRTGWFSRCTPSPGTGRTSPCCPVRKITKMRWGNVEMLLIEVKELNHRFDLSGHELTLKPQHCKAQMTQILMCAPALTCRNFAQPREGFHYFFF